MKKTNLITLVIASVLFVSCSKDDSKNNAAVKDGLCTDATINAFNAVNTAAKKVLYSSTRSDLVAVQNACINFKSLMGNSTCKALLTTEGQYTSSETTVDRTSKDQICNTVEQEIKNLDSRQTPPVKKAPEAEVISIEDQTKLIGMSGVLKMTIMKSSKIINSGSDVYFYQDGVASTKENLVLDSSKAVCFVITSDLNLNTLNAEVIFDSNKASEDGKTLVMSIKDQQDGFTQINCKPRAGQKPEDMNLNDIKKAFGSALKIELIK